MLNASEHQDSALSPACCIPHAEWLSPFIAHMLPHRISLQVEYSVLYNVLVPIFTEAQAQTT